MTYLKLKNAYFLFTAGKRVTLCVIFKPKLKVWSKLKNFQSLTNSRCLTNKKLVLRSNKLVKIIHIQGVSQSVLKINHIEPSKNKRYKIRPKVINQRQERYLVTTIKNIFMSSVKELKKQCN